MKSVDLTMKRGDTKIFLVSVTNLETGGPQDLTNYDIWCTAKNLLTDPDVDAVFMVTLSGGGITVVGAANNVIRVVIPATATAALTTQRTLYYDVQVRSPGGQVFTVLEGRLTVTLDVTRAI